MAFIKKSSRLRVAERFMILSAAGYSASVYKWLAIILSGNYFPKAEIDMLVWQAALSVSILLWAHLGKSDSDEGD